MRSHLLTGALVLSLAGGAVDVFAAEVKAPARDHARATERSWGRELGVRTGRALKTGITHTLHAIRPLPKGSVDQKTGVALTRRQRWWGPVKYTAMVGGIAAAGATAQAFHVDPTPYMLGLSGLAGVYTTKVRAIPRLRGTKGWDRYEVAVAEIGYPALLIAGSGAAGLALGHGGEVAAVAAEGGHQAAAHGSAMGPILNAGLKSGVIGIDVPTIISGAADHSGMGKPHTP